MKRNLILGIAALLLIFGAASAQAPTGKVIGRVLDDQGQPLPGVSIVATSPKMVGKATAVTDETGTYRLFALPSGAYTLDFTLEGFKPVKREAIQVGLDQTITLNVTMEPGALAEEITVVGQSPLIDVKSTTKGTTIKRELFMALPKGRDFNALLSVMPGVQYDLNTGGLSVDGATGTENVFYIDGTNINNVHVGTQAQSAVFEMVEEIKVTASGYNAEFGGSMGGVVNVITRSGGNEFHGDIIGYYNNNSLLMQGKARDYLRYNPYNDYAVEYVNDDDLFFDGGKKRDAYNRYEGVFNLGGFILKDRLWFYGSFNPVYSRDTYSRWFMTDPVGDPSIDPKIDPRQGRPLSKYNLDRNWWNYQVKLTAQPLNGLRLSASVVNNFYKYRGPNSDNGQGISINGTSSKTQPWEKFGFDYPNISGAFQADYSASNNLLLSLRGGYFAQDQGNQQVKMDTTAWIFNASNTIYPEIPANLRHFSGWSNTAWDFETKSNRYTRLSGNLDLTYYMNLGGEHAWKAGVQYIRLGENVDRTLMHPRVNIFWGSGYYGLANGQPVMGKYGHYQIRGSWTSPYGYIWDIHSDNWALYLQDTWTIGNRLTVNLGLRTESEYIPSFATLDPEMAKIRPIQFDFKDKLAPRLGLIYDVFGDSSLKVFGSFGIYYDVMKLYMAEGAYGGFKWITDYYELNDYDWTKIGASGRIDDRTSQEAGNKYIGSMNWRIPSWDTTDPGLKPVSKSEMSFGAEKKLTEEISFSARGVYKHLIRTIEDVGVLTPEGEMYYTANPSEGWSRPISQGGKFEDKYWPCPKPNWNYYGLNLALEKRLSDNWSGGFNYTWSRTSGCYGGLSSTDEAGRNSPNVERYYDLWFLQYDLRGNPLDGPLPTDRTHYFKLYGTYNLPFGLTIGAIGYARSGQPLTTTLNANNVAIYPENRADAGRLPFQYWMDLFLEYGLRLGGRYSLNFNLNLTQIGPAIATRKDMALNRDGMRITDDQILAEDFDYRARISNVPNQGPIRPNLAFGKYTRYMDPFQARLGVRFSF